MRDVGNRHLKTLGAAEINWLVQRGFEFPEGSVHQDSDLRDDVGVGSRTERGELLKRSVSTWLTRLLAKRL